MATRGTGKGKTAIEGFATADELRAASKGAQDPELRKILTQIAGAYERRAAQRKP